MRALILVTLFLCLITPNNAGKYEYDEAFDHRHDLSSGHESFNADEYFTPRNRAAAHSLPPVVDDELNEIAAAENELDDQEDVGVAEHRFDEEKEEIDDDDVASKLLPELLVIKPPTWYHRNIRAPFTKHVYPYIHRFFVAPYRKYFGPRVDKYVKTPYVNHVAPYLTREAAEEFCMRMSKGAQSAYKACKEKLSKMYVDGSVWGKARYIDAQTAAVTMKEATASKARHYGGLFSHKMFRSRKAGKKTDKSSPDIDADDVIKDEAINKAVDDAIINEAVHEAAAQDAAQAADVRIHGHNRDYRYKVFH